MIFLQYFSFSRVYISRPGTTAVVNGGTRGSHYLAVNPGSVLSLSIDFFTCTICPLEMVKLNRLHPGKLIYKIIEYQYPSASDIKRQQMKNSDKNSEIILLVNQCLAGDKEAYSRIVDRFRVKVFNICFHYLRTVQDAEDAVMEVFIKAYKALAGFDSRYAFSTWLFKIAVNHSLGILRRQKLEQDYIQSAVPAPGSMTLLADHRAPDAVFFDNTEQEDLETAVKKLPENYRTALMLKYQQDFSYREISEIMDIPVNTVGSLILRGKRELRRLVNIEKE